MQSANTITRDFNLQRKLNPDLGKAVGHTILSWSKEDGDKLDDQLMIEVTKAYMKKMGINDTQYLIVKHTDREHPHLHLVYNRVNNRGKTITDNNNYKHNVAACRTLTERYNFYMASGKEQVNRQRLKGKDQVRYAIYDAVKESLKSVENWDQMDEKLGRKGIEILYKYRSSTTEVQGISFKRDGLVFKGSAIDRAFSFAKLDHKLGENLAHQKQQNIVDLWNYRLERGQQSNRDTSRNYSASPASDTKNLLEILLENEYSPNDYNPTEEAAKHSKGVIPVFCLNSLVKCY